tara:strand:- start:413 stop:2236 length:1824 start_codon:yes stop_codon:yes gene_type:complete
MGNFIEQSAEDIMLNSMANVFMPEALDPVGKEDDDIDNDGDVDKSDKYLHKRRKAVGKAIAAEKAKRTRKEELELHLRTKIGELAEKKLYKSEKATNSDEKEVTIEEKPVKNTVVINPDVNESNQLDEFLAGRPGDGYIGHPNLDIKNPLAKKQVKKPVLPNAQGGGAVNRTGAAMGDVRMKQRQAIQNMLRNSYKQEGDLVEVVGDLRPRSNKSPVKTGGTPPSSYKMDTSKSGPITDRERIARIDAGKDPYPLKSAGEKERLSLGIKDIDMGPSPVKDGHAKFMKSLGLKPYGVAQGSAPKKGDAPKAGAPKGDAGPGGYTIPSSATPVTKGKEGPKAKKLSTVDTGSANPANVQDTIRDIKKKLKTEATYPSDFVKGSGVAKKKYGRPVQHDQPMKGPVRKTIDEQELQENPFGNDKALRDQERAAIRARAEAGMKKLDAQGGAVKALDALRRQASPAFSPQNDPNLVKTAPGIYRSKSAIKADGHKSFLPNSYEPTLKDEIQDILERTRYAKEKGKDFKTGKESKKGGTRSGDSAFDKVSKEMRKTGGMMSSRGKAIQPQGKKKEKGKKGYKGVTPVDKIKNRLAQKRKKKDNPYRARAGESD